MSAAPRTLSRFGELVRDRSLVVCVGPGGVGKTTVSAAIGLAAARLGRRAAVLTIDPARRLADALGLPGLDDAIRRVPTERLTGDRAIEGELWAAMVETAASYDALIERIALDEATLRRIRENRVFQAVSRSLARSHAYVAMERLYDAMEHGAYDLVVLDTPPARNAIEILDAPGRLSSFLDARIVGWLLPGERTGIGARLLAGGGQVARKLLELVTGPELLDEIVGFLDVFADLREGFVQRADRVQAVLHDEDTAFVLVSSASPASTDDAAWLHADLERRRVHVDAVVFNQSYVPLRAEDPAAVVTALPGDDPGARLHRLHPHLPPDVPDPGGLLGTLRALRASAAEENGRHARVVDGLEAELASSCLRLRAPRFDEEIRDLGGLMQLVDVLLGPR